jgi:cold shock protein
MTNLPRKIAAALLLVLAAGLAGCGGGVDVVDAGTYEGTVAEAKPSEQEIYVELADGWKLELYFTDDTELTSDGQPVEFDALAAGTEVRVTVSRDGNRNTPQKVEILP